MEISLSTSLADVKRPEISSSIEDESSDARNAHFFVVGCGRSGTTLLRVILLGHSRLYVGPETHFIRRLVKDIPLDAPLSKEQVEEVVRRIVAHARWVHMLMPADDFRAAALAQPAPRLADVLNIIYHHQRRAAGKQRIGDKTPDYVRHIPSLLKIYPNARFILLIRDGHDVAMSFAKLGWAQAYHGPRFEWSRAVRAILEYRKAPFADRILEVRYETMVRDLEGTVRRICDFLGEEFEPAMIEWHSQIDQLFPGESPKLHPKIYQPIRPDSVAAWRRDLSAVECFLMEASMYRDLELMGYELRFGGRLWRPLLAPVGRLMHAMSPLLDRALPALLRRKYLSRPLHI